MQRELGHLVDGLPHVLVADPQELALDDHVADDQHAAGLELAERAEREQHRGLHLDGQDAALGPAAREARIGLVEDVARHDLADANRLAEVLRQVHRLVDEAEVGGRRVRLAEHVVRRGRVGGGRRDRDHEVAHRHVGLEAAAGADAHDLLDAELDELLDHDRRRGAAHAARLHGDGLAVERSGVAEHPALAVPLDDVVEERLGDVLRPERVAGEEAGFGVVAGVGTNVNWHARKPRAFRVKCTSRSCAEPMCLEFASMRANLIEPTIDQILRYCAEAPVERVFLEDVARRAQGRFAALADGDEELTALCHLGSNVVPSGAGCGAFAELTAQVGSADADRGGRSRLRSLGRGPQEAAAAPRRPAGSARLRDHRCRHRPGDTGLRPATVADLDLLLPSCAAAHHEELGVDPLRRDADGFRWRTRTQIEEGRSWLWVEDGVIRFKAEASAWTPRRGAAPAGVDRSARPPAGLRGRALRDLIRLLLERTPTVCLFVRAENAPAIRLYESVGMHHVLDYRSVLL